jgi:hypothetical protein
MVFIQSGFVALLLLTGKLPPTKKFAADFANLREFSNQSAEIRVIRGKRFVV